MRRTASSRRSRSTRRPCTTSSSSPSSSARWCTTASGSRPLREALSAFVSKTQETVTGDVKLRIYKGNVTSAGITSPYSLYSEDIATFSDDGGAYSQKDAEGFINLFGLPLKVKAMLDEEARKMIRVFIDGGAGTTGLPHSWNGCRRAGTSSSSRSTRRTARTPPPAKRPSTRQMPSFCACPTTRRREAAVLAEGAKAVVIDASTAHRTADGWAYGFPELSASHRAAIAGSKRIANPGCYASGFISLVYPLIARGIAAKDYPFVCHAVSGYTGAGKKGIAEYEAEERDPALRYAPPLCARAQAQASSRDAESLLACASARLYAVRLRLPLRHDGPRSALPLDCCKSSLRWGSSKRCSARTTRAAASYRSPRSRVRLPRGQHARGNQPPSRCS